MVDRYEAFYKDSKLTQIEKAKKIQEKLESDPYLNSLWLGWGYAGTCHKAQGSEWPHVVFDLGNSEWAGSAFAYTGLTRAQETLTILNLDNYRGSLQGEDLNLIGLDDLNVLKISDHIQKNDNNPQKTDAKKKNQSNISTWDKLINWKKNNN